MLNYCVFISLFISFCVVAPSRLDVGSGLVVELNEESASYQISYDQGLHFLHPKKVEHEIHMIEKVWDPLSEDAPYKHDAGFISNVYIVQFETMLLQEYRQILETKFGCSVHFTVPHQAALVYIPKNQLSAVKSLPFVRWIGEYSSQYKLAGETRDYLSEKNNTDFTQIFSFLLLEPEMQDPVNNFIESIGGKVTVESSSRRTEALLTSSQFYRVLEMKEVVFVDLWKPNERCMDIARIISGAEYLEEVAGYDGEGVRAEVQDDGLRRTHIDFSHLNLIPHGDFSNGNHGTACFGINFGSGSGDKKAKGLCPKAEAAIFSAWMGNRKQKTRELVDPTGPYRAVYQSNSWTACRGYQYNSYSAEMDEISLETDLLILQAFGNFGDTGLHPTEGLAKNVVSVGATYHYDTLTKADDRWNNGASMGPVKPDGRIGPDVLHFFDRIFTTTGTSDTAYTPSFGGTSGATPIVAGLSGLMLQMWSDGVFSGKPGQGRDVFKSRPSSSTSKAMLINTADQYPFEGPNADHGRNKQGWGMPNVGNMWDQAVTHDYKFPVLVDGDKNFKQNSDSVHTYEYTVPFSSEPGFLSVTLTYRDAPGLPSAAIQLVNDISVKATSPNGDVYHGNYDLVNNMFSKPGGTPDSVNNVENILVEKAEPGKWVFEVSGDKIIVDTHLQTPEIDADYSLIVSSAV